MSCVAKVRPVNALSGKGGCEGNLELDHVSASRVSAWGMARDPATPACLLNGRAHAQMSLFLATCAAQARHLERLPPAFAKAGMVEVDAAAGPSGPGIATSAPDRRLWSAPGKPGGGDSFAGYTPLGDRPFAVCWVVSRPGLSAACRPL